MVLSMHLVLSLQAVFDASSRIKWHVEHILVSDSDSTHRLRVSLCGEVINAVLQAQTDTGYQPRAADYHCLLLNLEYEFIFCLFCLLYDVCLKKRFEFSFKGWLGLCVCA